MKHTHTLSRSLVAFLLSATMSHAADPLPVSKDYWKSDSFRKAFNASYRINARVEPFVDTKERGLLVELQGLMAKGQRTKALETLKKSPLIKTSAAIMFNAGNISYEAGDHAYASQQYLAAIKQFPTFLRAHQNLAVVYAQQGEYGKAFPHLLEAVRLGSQDGMVMGLLGYCYQQKGSHASALQAFRNAQLTDSQNIEWKRGEAFCHDQLGELDKALHLYKEVVKSRPNEPSYVLLLVNLYQRLDKPEEAIVWLELLRRKGQLKEIDKVLLGQLHLRYGSRRIGREVIREVLKSGKLKEMKAVLDIILFSLDQDDLERAKEFYLLIKTDTLRDEDSMRIYQRLGAWIALNDDAQKDKSIALQSLRDLIKSDPLDTDSLYLLAGYEGGFGDKEKAIMLYDQALKGTGTYKSRALLEKGKLLVQLKHYNRAIKVLTEYAKTDNSPSIRSYIKAVQALTEANL